METNTYKKLKNRPQNNFPEMIICHHSGGTNANPLADTSHHTAQIMEAYHLSLGWDGLGYHYAIHEDGKVWKGRPEHINGAHTIGQNTKSIGIVLSGNFDATLPSKEQEKALAGLIATIRAKYPAIGRDNIYPHRKFANKSCYGKLLGDDWAKNLIASPDKEHIKEQIKNLVDLL